MGHVISANPITCPINLRSDEYYGGKLARLREK
jgi:hypothetical protein